MVADSARPILERRGDRAVVSVHDDALVLLGPLQVAAGPAVVQMTERAPFVDVCRGRLNTPALARSGGLERLGSDARSWRARA
jgi:hypothetical protein